MSNNAIGKNIETLRLATGLTQTEFGEKLGVTRTTIYKWEHGDPIRQTNIDAICNTFNVSERDIRGFSDGLYAKTHGLTNIIEAEAAPEDSWAYVIGNVAAGDPREAIEITGEKHYVDPRIKQRYPHGRFLKLAGDSMNLILPEGCYVYFAEADYYEWHSGDIVVVKVNGDDATVKRITTTNGIIILEPESTNPQWRRIIIDETNPDAPYFKVLGKVVWFDGEL